MGESEPEQRLVLGELSRHVTELYVVVDASGPVADGKQALVLSALLVRPRLDPTWLRWPLPLLPGLVWPGPKALALPVTRSGTCPVPLDNTRGVGASQREGCTWRVFCWRWGQGSGVETPQVCPEKVKVKSHSGHVISLNRGVTGEQEPLPRVHVAWSSDRKHLLLLSAEGEDRLLSGPHMEGRKKAQVCSSGYL